MQEQVDRESRLNDSAKLPQPNCLRNRLGSADIDGQAVICRREARRISSVSCGREERSRKRRTKSAQADIHRLFQSADMARRARRACSTVTQRAARQQMLVHADRMPSLVRDLSSRVSRVEELFAATSPQDLRRERHMSDGTVAGVAGNAVSVERNLRCFPSCSAGDGRRYVLRQQPRGRLQHNRNAAQQWACFTAGRDMRGSAGWCVCASRTVGNDQGVCHS